MYPDKEFPTPDKYPHMYPEGSVFTVHEITVDIFNEDCSDPRVCPKGLIDYECQYENECYLNLA